MKLLWKLSFALCLAVTAQTAQAQSIVNHEVFITQKGYFPDAIYISTTFTGVDDTITFFNMSGQSARLRYKKGNKWVYISPWIDDTESHMITLTSALRNQVGSTFPVPEMDYGSVSRTMALRDEVVPLSCPNSRPFCNPTFTNGSANP